MQLRVLYLIQLNECSVLVACSYIRRNQSSTESWVHVNVLIADVIE